MHKALAVRAESDLRVPMEPFLPGKSPQTFHSLTCLSLLIMDELGSSPVSESNFSSWGWGQVVNRSIGGWVFAFWCRRLTWDPPISDCTDWVWCWRWLLCLLLQTLGWYGRYLFFKCQNMPESSALTTLDSVSARDYSDIPRLSRQLWCSCAPRCRHLEEPSKACKFM